MARVNTALVIWRILYCFRIVQDSVVLRKVKVYGRIVALVVYTHIDIGASIHIHPGAKYV